MHCPHCFRKGYTGGACPFCGWDGTGQEKSYPLALPPGTILNERYILGHVLGQGGFGITYIALDSRTGERVAIKEYLPTDCAGRASGSPSVLIYSGTRAENFAYGKDRFLEEARTLAAFIGSANIVRIHRYFEENDTAYFCMEYVDGLPFERYIASKGGRLSPTEADRLLLPLMEALEEVHARGIIHRDIAPDNILIDRDGTAKLIDFGAARYSTGEKTQNLTVILKHGFAPYEQYMRSGRQGPWTDVYAMAATYYYAITGEVPPDAVERKDGKELPPPVSKGVIISDRQEAVLLWALDLDPSRRFQSMAEFRQAMLDTSTDEREAEEQRERELREELARLEQKRREREKREAAAQPEPERLQREAREKAGHLDQNKAGPDVGRQTGRAGKAEHSAAGGSTAKKSKLPMVIGLGVALVLLFGLLRAFTAGTPTAPAAATASPTPTAAAVKTPAPTAAPVKTPTPAPLPSPSAAPYVPATSSPVPVTTVTNTPAPTVNQSATRGFRIPDNPLSPYGKALKENLVDGVYYSDPEKVSVVSETYKTRKENGQYAPWCHGVVQDDLIPGYRMELYFADGILFFATADIYNWETGKYEGAVTLHYWGDQMVACRDKRGENHDLSYAGTSVHNTVMAEFGDLFRLAQPYA